MTKVQEKSTLPNPANQPDVPLLDTLVLRRKGQENQGLQSDQTGTLKNLQKRERSKYYTGQILSGVRKDESSKLHKYFNRAHHCNHVIEQNGKRLTSKYCNTRFCHICNRIRTAKLMNGYGDQISEFSDPQFVTLTAPTVKADEFQDTVRKYLSQWSKILGGWRKKYKSNRPKGIRKLEVTYNAEKDWYHPHFHVIIDGKEMAEELVSEWLSRNPTAAHYLQDIQPVDQGSLNELFKYASKPFTKVKVSGKGKRTIEVYDYALQNIAQATWGKKSIQPFGGLKRVDEEVDESTLNGQVYPELEDTPFKVWIYDESSFVHVSKYGEILVDYNAPDMTFNHVNKPPEAECS